MTLLKILVNMLGQVLTWCASRRAQRFVEDHFRGAGYDEDSVHVAREAARLLAVALIALLMKQILQFIATY